MRSIDLLKKIILILLCACMLVAYVGCDNGANEETQSEELTETMTGGGETTIEETTIEETTIEDNQCAPPIEIETDSELIATLVDYLQHLNVDYEICEGSIETKINDIKYGAQPLHVRFDSSNSYYVCGYYDSTDEKEKTLYQNAEKYTWIQYENVKDIRDSYDGKKIIVSFQMNKSDFVIDILEHKSVPQMEHFEIYEPTFENGFNIGKVDNLSESSFIYLNTSDKETVYYSSSLYNHNNVTFSCVEYYEKDYITLLIASERRSEIFELDDEYCDNQLRAELGDYYDVLKELTILDWHYITDEQEITHMYGIIEVGAFINAISKSIAKERLFLEIQKAFNTDSKIIEFIPDIYVYNASLSGESRSHLTIDNGDIYINGSIYDEIEIIHNLDVVFSKGVFIEIDILERRGDAEIAKAIRNTVEKIDNSVGCYILLNSAEHPDHTARYGLLEIEGNYYLMDLSSRFGDVVLVVYILNLENEG